MAALVPRDREEAKVGSGSKACEWDIRHASVWLRGPRLLYGTREPFRARQVDDTCPFIQICRRTLRTDKGQPTDYSVYAVCDTLKINVDGSFYANLNRDCIKIL